MFSRVLRKQVLSPWKRVFPPQRRAATLQTTPTPWQPDASWQRRHNKYTQANTRTPTDLCFLPFALAQCQMKEKSPSWSTNCPRIRLLLQGNQSLANACSLAYRLSHCYQRDAAPRLALFDNTWWMWSSGPGIISLDWDCDRQIAP